MRQTGNTGRPGAPASGRITVRCESTNVAAPATFGTQSLEVKAAERETVVEFVYQPGDDVRFIPGHGPMSTFGEERRSNPFVGDSAVAGR